MDHEGTRHHLFLTGLVDGESLEGTLFAAVEPWGRWIEVERLPAGFIPGLLAKDATRTGVSFTAAGGEGVTRNLHAGRIEFTVDS